MTKLRFWQPRFVAEESWVLVGTRYDRYWIGRLRRPTTGSPACVDADDSWAFRREEQRGDVVGFLHTHPPQAGASPSSTDRGTMQAWVDSFGKPLICLIRCRGTTRGTVFTAWDDPGHRMRRVVWIDDHTVIAIW